MRKYKRSFTYKGSFTIEAALILPLVLSCFCIAAGAAVSLHNEICVQIQEQNKKESVNLIKGMYRRTYVKELLGNLYEY